MVSEQDMREFATLIFVGVALLGLIIWATPDTEDGE